VNAHKNPVGAMESGNTDKSDKFCSGTLISENLFLTASHCVDASTPKSQYVAFNYEKAKGSNDLLPQKHFKITKVVETHVGNLDYAIIQLDGKPGVEFGFTKVKAAAPVNGDKLTIIQHPQGEPKQIEVGNMVGVDGNYMEYADLDTQPGSSGSGVLDANGMVVGVHTNGGCTSDGGSNRGVLLSEIVKVSKVIQGLNSKK
jgi:V8-like Glu-specific endopeptidase